MLYGKFTDYLKEKLQNEEILVGHINEALEQEEV
ncbi:hypothetical protein Rh054_07105 [Rickettsia conorii subsp. heilongjiangensis 054]|nr:hypothetical protein Rh054_07105 [Rickettsia conorii subsp. heilongjiangensis 054]